jgi:hypothetical protein
LHVSVVQGFMSSQSEFIKQAVVPLLLLLEEVVLDDEALRDEVVEPVVPPAPAVAWKKLKSCVHAIGATPKEITARARNFALRTSLPPGAADAAQTTLTRHGQAPKADG